MDFHHLKYFVEVADKKSFSKAARTLHISQSAISRTIKALEEELGVVLFMRNAKAVELTDAGTIFLSHAKRVVFMFEHLKTDFENEFKLEQGTILIGLPPITGAPIFANLLGAFKQEYPQIELDLYEHGSKKVEISVQEGLIDLGIVCTQPKEKDFESFFLTQDPMNVIIHRDNILSKEKTEYTISGAIFTKENLLRLKPVIYIAMLIAYALLLPHIGFIISSLLLANGILLYFGTRKWWFYAIASANVIVAYFAFQAMSVTLP